MVDVRPARLEDRELLARICAEGFFLDPVLSWVFRDDANRLDRLTLMFGGLVDDYLPDRGVAHLAGGASVAFWRDPAFEDVTTAADRVAGAADPPPFLEDELARLAVLGAVMEEHHPHVPHWYLNVVSTRPSHQSRGLGAAVLRPVLDQADAAGMPCYLESTNPRNRTLYYRQGFEDRDELVVDDGVSMLQMWREPRPPA